MCQGCEYVVAGCGESLDALIETHSELITLDRDRSSAQNCMRLATLGFEAILESECHVKAVREMCLTVAVAVHRLAVLQQIHGSPL